MFVLAATSSLFAGSTAATAAAPAADTNCAGWGVGALVAPGSAAYIKNRTTGKNVGSVQLCRRYDASAGIWVRFAWVTLYYDMSSGQHANGRVQADDGVDRYQRLCSDAGGGGAIFGGTGDRTCGSAGLLYVSGLIYNVDAFVYNAAGTMIAYGAVRYWYT